jgi:hypothetical protein
MNTETLSLIIGCLNLVGLFYVVVLRLSRIESRVEILWAFQLRRGIVESVNSGLLEHHSPLAVSKGILVKYPAIFNTIKEYYDLEGSKLPDLVLVESIEKNFWPLVSTICIGENIHDGACLALMLNYVRPEAKFFKEWEPIEWNHEVTEEVSRVVKGE